MKEKVDQIKMKEGIKEWLKEVYNRLEEIVGTIVSLAETRLSEPLSSSWISIEKTKHRNWLYENKEETQKEISVMERYIDLDILGYYQKKIDELIQEKVGYIDNYNPKKEVEKIK